MKKLTKIPAIAKWTHWRIAKELGQYKLSTVVDMGGVGRLKKLTSFKVTDANTKHGIDATNMPFEDKSFDASISINTLEHVKFKRQFLLEAERVARVVSIHEFPFGPHAKQVEELKKKLGHRHPCKLPNYRDHILPFMTNSSFVCNFKPAMSCQVCLLLLASMNEKMNVDETFQLAKSCGDAAYSYIFIIEPKGKK